MKHLKTMYQIGLASLVATMAFVIVVMFIQVSALTVRVSELENRPVVVGGNAIP